MTGFPVRLFKNGLGLTGTVCRNTPHQLGVFSKKISSQNIGVGGLTADIVPSWILLLYDIHDTWCYTASEVHGGTGRQAHVCHVPTFCKFCACRCMCKQLLGVNAQAQFFAFLVR